MTTFRQFSFNDLFRFNVTNLDPLTETVNTGTYVIKTMFLTAVSSNPSVDIIYERLDPNSADSSHWSEYFLVAESASGEIMGYIMGKSEGYGENWHGHVTALTVSPQYRRLGLAIQLMAMLEMISEKKNCYYVDLFVRVSNQRAFALYKALGYIIYRTVLEYYSGNPDEDAFDMRKALSRDKEKRSMIPLEFPVRLEDSD